MTIAALHKELLTEIIKNSGKATQHTFLDSYLGNSNVRYAISMPKLRSVGKTWFKSKVFTPEQFFQFVTALIKGKSSTEKMMGGIFLDFAPKFLPELDPKIFDTWLNYLEGWAEVDTLCYGHFKVNQFLGDWTRWKKLLIQLNKSKNINKRRSSLVILCKPLTRTDDEVMRELAFKLIDQLKHEREVLITKAISWLLRSMVKLHKNEVSNYIKKSKVSLPAIAVRETLTKIKTGRKNG